MNYVAWVDGACRNNGKDGQLGDGAVGVIIYKSDKLVGQFARALGKCTNNQAELTAIETCALMAWAADLRDITIYSDSRLAVNLVNNVYKLKDDNLKPILLTIREIQSAFRFKLEWCSRNQGKIYEADAIAGLMLDKVLLDLDDSPQNDHLRKKR